MLVALIFIWAVYLVLLTGIYLTWRTLKAEDDQTLTTDWPSVSVVIAMRNEAHNLSALLESLEAQDYPRQHLEVIAVNDHSEDQTAALLESFSQQYSGNFKFVNLTDPPDFRGSFKKRALTEGIGHATNPVIVTTDADCTFHSHWLSTLVGYMAREKAAMVCAPVALTGRLQGIQALGEIEQAALVAVGAGFMKWGYPNMCNGANLAFTKAAFYEVGGYQGFHEVVSGDDEFLLYKIYQKYPSAIRFLKHSEAVVHTQAPADWRELFHQRKRWSGKWKHHRSAITKGLALFIFLFHISWLISAALTLIGNYPWMLWLGEFILKLALEYLVVASVISLAGKRPSWVWFLMGQLVYSWYVLFFGVAANWGGFVWKNREYS